MLHYDHYYTMGKTHAICEDFAIQADKPIPFIVLSDGCSSSSQTHIGARILTLTTKYIIENTADWPLNYTSFGQQLIDKAWNVARTMQLSSSVLDATVMLAFLYQDNILVYVYGDGCLLFKDYHNNLSTIEVVFTHNAPYYLTYWYDEERQKEYAKYDPTPLILIDSRQGQSQPKSFNEELAFCFPLEKFKVVAIASDGATYCVDTRHHRKLPLDEIATQLLNFPNLTDDFVKLHLQNTLAQYAQQGIYPADDLSMGVFAQ
ncbi:hypothetical protein THII_0060 [Thioploca ingrica]|uniref:PPM-type phosphatase domain-containing protein n=1 Tax=Thioploca ingrica TaxID=40754 RepID=A0A090AGL9_9GAMM|nr:hypothetical protein THII_0060 [Thioploca ingrica]